MPNCTCGRRTYLLSQCFKCLKEELLERQEEELKLRAAGRDEPPELAKESIELPGSSHAASARGGPGAGDFGLITDQAILKFAGHSDQREF